MFSLYVHDLKMKQLRSHIRLSGKQLVHSMINTKLTQHHFETKQLIKQRHNLSMVTKSNHNVQMVHRSHSLMTSILPNTTRSISTINDCIDLYATDDDEEEEEDIDVIGWTKVNPSSTHYEDYDYEYQNSNKKINCNKTQKDSCKDIAPCFAQSYVILYLYICTYV